MNMDKGKADIRPPNNLRTFREVSLMSQEKLSELTNIPAPYISQIERGIMNPSGEQIIALCKVFKIAADVLFPEARRQGGEENS